MNDPVEGAVRGEHTSVLAEQETIVVEKIVPGGDGFLRLADGLPVFVPRAFPGDRVRLTSLKRRSGYARATGFELVTPSPERVQPPCAVAQDCGGCDLMGLTTEAQRRSKLGLLSEALRRTGGLSELPEIQFFAASQLKYRSRVRVQVSDGRLGFFARGTHRLVEFSECLVCSPELSTAIERLRAWFRHFGADVGQSFAEVEVRAFVEGNPSACFSLHRSRRGLGPNERRALNELSEEFIIGVKKGQRIVYRGPNAQRVAIGDARLRLSPFDFSQVHWEVNQAITAELTNGAGRRGLKRFVDLFCGAGNFSLPLLVSGLSGVGVEQNPEAIESARESLRALRDEGAVTADRLATFYAGDASETLSKLGAQGPFDLAVIDPPRSGAKAVIDALVPLAPDWVFLCACDPVTFARDVRRLTEQDVGYVLENVTAYDMFPQTHHLEVTAWLSLRA